jgi:hypothetical protein
VLVVAQQRPGVKRSHGLLGELSKALNKIPPILFIDDDPSPLDPPDHHVVQGSNRVRDSPPFEKSFFQRLIKLDEYV